MVCVSSKMIGRRHGSIITGSRQPLALACVASARTHRDFTEAFDQSTTTARACSSACSVTWSNASPGLIAWSHQTLRPSCSKPSAKRRAVA